MWLRGPHDSVTYDPRHLLEWAGLSTVRAFGNAMLPEGLLAKSWPLPRTSPCSPSPMPSLAFNQVLCPEHEAGRSAQGPILPRGDSAAHAQAGGRAERDRDGRWEMGVERQGPGFTLSQLPLRVARGMPFSPYNWITFFCVGPHTAAALP